MLTRDDEVIALGHLVERVRRVETPEG
jgi:hypothetical protein